MTRSGGHVRIYMSDKPGQEHFVDTNILVYAFDHFAGHKDAVARQLLEGWWEKRNACLSIQVLQKFYVTVSRKIQQPLNPRVARRIVSDLSHWRVHSPDAMDVLQAMDDHLAYQLSFWDAMHLVSARRLGCAQVFSEDLAHGQDYGGIRVVNPFV
jgi:predicted nucleic acid-binding protein